MFKTLYSFKLFVYLKQYSNLVDCCTYCKFSITCNSIHVFITHCVINQFNKHNDGGRGVVCRWRGRVGEAEDTGEEEWREWEEREEGRQRVASRTDVLSIV